MRAFQTDYFDAVGEPCGLLRDGPNRRRLKRSEWARERDAAKRKTPSRLDGALTEIDRQHEVQLARAQALGAREKWILDREHTIAQAERDQSALQSISFAVADAVSGDTPIPALEEFEEVKAASERVRALALALARTSSELQSAMRQVATDRMDTENRMTSLQAEEELLQRKGKAHEGRVAALDANLEAAEKIIAVIETGEAAPDLGPELTFALPRLEPVLNAMSAAAGRTRADAVTTAKRLADADRIVADQQDLLKRIERDSEVDRHALAIERREVQKLRETLSRMMGRMISWLRHSGLPLSLRAEARLMALELDPARKDLPAVNMADLQVAARPAKGSDEPEGVPL